ncbi:MAG TPA: hypothetical protein VK142_06780 [Bacillota bacterium]|nr:hypothetical protein [Bacillota bacterium]
MKCEHCEEPIRKTETYCTAGLKHTVFCSKKCAYQAFRKFYTKDEVDQTMQILQHPITNYE